MDQRARIESEIMVLTQEIANAPQDYTLYMERGRLYHRNGSFDKAMNDFIKVKELSPNCSEAIEYISMLEEIFAFRYTDLYNP